MNAVQETVKGKSQVERIVEHFLKSNEPKAYGNYATNGKVLIYVVPEKRTREVLAVKFNKGLIIGNSSGLDHAPKIENPSRFGRRKRFTGESIAQAELAKHIAMIPFGVFTQAKLDLSKFSLIERGPEETLTRRWTETVYTEKAGHKEVEKTETRHFTGASLFKVDGEVFLFDFDRGELEHGILNPFLVKLTDKTVKSISAAYDSLKPETVKQAERQGLKVLRQGEWFFIPVNEITAKGLERATKENAVKRITLQAGPNRPNRAEGFQIYQGRVIADERDLRNYQEIQAARAVAEKSQYFVTGTVSHDGREHKDLTLKGWYTPVSNTASSSWTVTGDVD